MKVYAYYEQLAAEQFVQEPILLGKWRASWRRQGWEPVVLTRRHAEAHPDFGWYSAEMGSLPTVNYRDYELACWIRWLALAQVMRPREVAVFSDYDVFNRAFTPQDALATAHGSKPVNLDENYGGGPFIVSGSAAQAIPALMQVVIRYLRKFAPEANHWADMEVWKAMKYHDLGWVEHREISRLYDPNKPPAALVHVANRVAHEAKMTKVQVFDLLEKG